MGNDTGFVARLCLGWVCAIGRTPGTRPRSAVPPTAGRFCWSRVCFEEPIRLVEAGATSLLRTGRSRTQFKVGTSIRSNNLNGISG